jgi:glycerophosphoryl diester phosphodiesterase
VHDRVAMRATAASAPGSSNRWVARTRTSSSAARVGHSMGRVPEGDTAAARLPWRVSDLHVPLWIAHRGMANVYPENTLEAFRGTLACGLDMVEPDCWFTRDGGLVCMHDGSVDRTTDGSGATDRLTTAGVRALRVDAGRWFAAAWPNTLRVPTFGDVLDEVGGRAGLCPEAKNAGAGRAIVEQLTQHDLLDTALVQSFMQAELRPAIAAGCEAMMLTATSSYDPVRLCAVGIRYLGLSAALPPSLVAPARTAGVEVIVWVVDRRVDAAPWLSAGALGFFSNDPMYLSGHSPVLAADPFGRCTFYHGHLASSIAGNRGQFSTNGWGYPDTSPHYQGALQGWASPIHEDPTADQFEITFRVRIDAVSADNGWAGAFIAAADDRSFDDLDRYQPGLCGYHVMLRRSGKLEVHVVDDGITRAVSSAATPAIKAGDTARLHLCVTPTQVTATRLDASAPTTVVVTDASHRGGYFHLGRRAAAVAFSDITIS